MPKPLDFSRLTQFENPEPENEGKTIGQGVRSEEDAPFPDERAKASRFQESTPTRQNFSSTRWPSREAPMEGQFTIRAKLDQIHRFKALCRPDGGGRYTYGEMLERMMNLYEKEMSGER